MDTNSIETVHGYTLDKRFVISLYNMDRKVAYIVLTCLFFIRQNPGSKTAKQKDTSRLVNFCYQFVCFFLSFFLFFLGGGVWVGGGVWWDRIQYFLCEKNVLRSIKADKIQTDISVSNIEIKFLFYALLFFHLLKFGRTTGKKKSCSFCKYILSYPLQFQMKNNSSVVQW